MAAVAGAVILLLAAAAQGAPIRVAVEQAPSSSGTGADLVAQLNDDTWFDLDAALVSADQIDTAAELAAYDVVILGHPGSGSVDFTPAMAAALEEWVRLGLGGVIGNAWLDFGLSSGTATDIGEPLDEVLPIDAWPGSYAYCSTPELVIVSGSHPITLGLSDFAVGSAHVEYSADPPDATAGEVLATGAGGSCSTTGDRNAVVVGEHGAGRIAYLGLQYGAAGGYSPEGLRTGEADQLLEQAVAWVAPFGLDDADGDGDPDVRDCDDADPTVHTGAVELCNGVDDDCSGVIDDLSPWYADADGDGHGDPAGTVSGCEIPEGYVASGDDCDDADPTVHPGADEHCDLVDEDCDGLVDDHPVDPTTWYFDGDGDGYGEPTVSLPACEQPIGYTSAGGDCHDADATVHPDADERCNRADDDCDGAIDEDAYTAYWPDGDRDGYGIDGEAIWACEPPFGTSARLGDCDDADPAVNPDAVEACNARDDDCDLAVDEHTACADDDGDGWTEDDGDCDDADPGANPDADEILGNERDDDCDGETDERSRTRGGGEDEGRGCRGCASRGSAGIWPLLGLVLLRRPRRRG